MKKVLFILLFSVLAFSAGARCPLPEADPPAVMNVDADSLVRYMRSRLSMDIYIARQEGDVRLYTVSAGSREAFAAEALRQLRDNGYRISDHVGRQFLLYGKSLVIGLPAGFFEQKEKSGTETPSLLSSVFGPQGETTSWQNKIYEIGDRNSPRTGGKSLVRGYVRDAATGEPIVGVSAYDDRGTAYAQTDADGYYRINLPPGDNILCFSGPSLEDVRYMLRVFGDGNLDIRMQEKVFSLTGVVVTAEHLARHRTPRMGIEKVNVGAIKNVPVAFGEADVLKVVMTLPGVKTVGEVSNGFNVRGGSSDQNLILFNKGTIYNPSHLFGMMSVFNPDVAGSAELYKSSIPVEFGGRISSVLEVRSREGDDTRIKGSLSLGMLTSRGHLEGPIAKGKTTFILGGRATYGNWLRRFLPEGSGYANGTASFYDLNAGVTHRFSRDHSLQAYAYISRDRFSFSNDTSFRYDNLNLSLHWRSRFASGGTFTASAGYDDYGYRIEDTYDAAASYSFSSRISQPWYKAKYRTSLGEKNVLSTGLDAVLLRLSPGAVDPIGAGSLILSRSLVQERALDGALFLSDEWNPSESLSLEGGIRYSLFKTLGDGSFYHAPEYRLSAKYSFSPHFSWKAGFNTMHQYIHKITNSINISPTDTWKLSDADVRPQEGWQAATGFYYTTADNLWDFSLEAYYKHGRHFVDYRPGAILIMNDRLADDLIPTFGKSYGVEWMVKKEQGKLNGWISYSWSRAFLREMEDRGVFTVNRGEWYPASYDKPHELKVVGNYRLTHRYSISANLDYSTGRPVTLPVGMYEYGGGLRLVYSDRNGYRIPDYLRLDMALVVEPGHYLKQFTHFSFTLGVYNVTGRKNPYSVFYSVNKKSVSGKMLCIFGAQIPYINLNLKF